MDLPGTPQTEWPQVLECYEWDWAPDHGYLMWMVELIRLMRSCKGIDKLYPGTSLFSLLVSRWHEGLQAGPPFLSIHLGKHGVFELKLCLETYAEPPIYRQFAGPALKEIRRLVRRLGVRLGPPRREPQPPLAYRWVWVVVPGGRWNH